MNKHLKHNLQQIAADNIPDGVNLWPVVRTQVHPRRATKASCRHAANHTTGLGGSCFGDDSCAEHRRIRRIHHL